MNIEIPKELNSIINKIKEANAGIYLVGGAIRNYLLNKPVKDYDFCITGLTKKQFKELFSKAELVGKHFGVFLLNGHEFAMARSEQLQKNADTRRDYDVDFNVSIEEDLKRRDFTVNAIAYDLINKQIIDPFNGQKDIDNKILRSFTDSFKDDPLRVLRAGRFAAQYNFVIEIRTFIDIIIMSERLKNIPSERVFEEFKKAIKGKYPHKFFLELVWTHSLNFWFKEIYNLINVKQPKKYHPEGDAFNHSLQALYFIDSNRPEIKFAALMHDIGKGLTPIKEYPHHYQHCKYGIEALDNFNNRLKIPNKWYKCAKIAIEEHMRIWKWEEMKPGKIVRLFKKINRSPMLIEDLIKIAIADEAARVKDIKKGIKNLEKTKKKFKGLKNLYYRMFKEANGSCINEKPGLKFGRKLFQYRCHWIKKERNIILKGEDN